MHNLCNNQFDPEKGDDMSSIQTAIISQDKYDDSVVVDFDTISRMWVNTAPPTVDFNQSFGKITLYPCQKEEISVRQKNRIVIISEEIS